MDVPMWRRRAGAVLEVLGVSVVGLLLGAAIAAVLGIPMQNPLLILQSRPGTDLITLVDDLAVVLLIQYIGLMIPALLVGWWRQKRRLSAYGLTTGGFPLRYLLLAGVAGFALADLPEKALTLVGQFIHLGETAAWREILLDKPHDPGYWLIMAVGSFVLPPILEELFYRGVVQTRLEEDFEAPTAILMTAFFFALAHGQYFNGNLMSIGTLVSALGVSVTLGYLYHRTRSLLPSILMHALLNIPVNGMPQIVVMVVMLGILFVCRHQIVRHVRHFARAYAQVPQKWALWLMVGVMALFSVAFTLVQVVALLAGLACAVSAVVLIALEKRTRKMALRETLTEELLQRVSGNPV